MTPSDLEETIAWQMKAAKLPEPEREFRFHPKRRWRCDFAWPSKRVALEVEGGHWSGGRHVRGSGFESDCEKYNALAILGWAVLRVTGKMINDGSALKAVECALNGGV